MSIGLPVSWNKGDDLRNTILLDSNLHKIVVFFFFFSYSYSLLQSFNPIIKKALQ